MGSVKLSTLVFDSTIWPRLQRDPERVAQFVDVLRSDAGKALPDIKVDRNTRRVLGGWHTVAAYQTLKIEDIPVEWVTLKDDSELGALLYSYREDAESALPYRDADVRSVARRIYELKRGANGDLPNVTDIARQLGRRQQTVAGWLTDLVEKDKATLELKRAGRVLAIHAFRAAGLSLRRIGILVGVTQTQVSSDTEVSIALHLADSRIVSEAQSLIHLAIGKGADLREAEAARDWIIEKTDPAYLRDREQHRAWTAVASEVRDWTERVTAFQIPPPPAAWSGCESVRAEIREAINLIETSIIELKARVK